ncbi:glycosyltransferase family 1 protein [uncultured Duncaniella sp.]|uniref:glycosyltransferase family 4 protein n=1 Tax=uncultured Duncaniella sp. TaxID=2768039 RepID=UPI0026595D49|nr:glycosyltransferase family 1 protein [uncultured Duncaniella sp.]
MATIRSIAFDAKRALFNHTGLGNYSRYAIETMQRAYPEAELSLYTRKIHRRQMHPWLKRLNMPRLVTPDRGTLLPALWRHWRGMTGALRRDRPDVYHGLSNELPFDIRRAGIPTVVTIHDLIFRRIPENYTAIDRWLYNLKFRSAARNATRIIAISERTKADIIELYGIDPAKIDVIYQGVNPIFHQPVSEETREEVRQKYGLPERYIVMVGTLEQRKNQLIAIEALPEIDKDVTLVIVGHARNKYGEQVKRRIEELGLQQRVKMLRGVPTEHLPALYAMAEIAAYPSRYEGFGLPVVESLSTGTPVIAATGSCLEEAGGKGAVYIDPDSPTDFAHHANLLLADPALRRSMAAAGLSHISRFDDAGFARNVMETYHRAIEDFNRTNGINES